MITFLLAGCVSSTPLSSVPTLSLVQLGEPNVAPSWVLSVSGSAGPARVELEGGGERWNVLLQGSRVMQIRGLLPDTTYTVSVTIGTNTTRTTIESPPAPDWLPRMDVLVDEPDRVEPGLLLFAATPLDRPGSLVLALDEQLRVRWWLVADATWSFATVSPTHTLVGLVGGRIEERGWDGTLLRHFTDRPGAPEDLPLARSLNHEAFPMEDGTVWSIASDTVVFDTYPASYQSLDPVGPPVDVEDTPVVRIGADGSEISTWSLADRLDQGRVTFNGIHLTPDGMDWVHANAVVPDGLGGVVVSARNQDALFRLDPEGDLDWILADPGGWAEPWASHLLRPVGELRWPYHQHGPQWSADRSMLVVFDNVDAGCNPYVECPAEPGGSRAVAYEIDPVERTVRQLWELDQTATGPVMSHIFGNARELPLTGNVLATFGAVLEEDGVPNPDSGRGRASVRLVEWDPSDPGHPVRDLRLYSAADEGAEGWQVYRSERFLPDWAGWPPRPTQ